MLIPKLLSRFSGEECPHIPAAGDDNVEFCLGAMRVIRAVGFAGWNPHQREVERMPLRQIERVTFPTKSDGDIFDPLLVFPFGRGSLAFRNLTQVDLLHELVAEVLKVSRDAEVFTLHKGDHFLKLVAFFSGDANLPVL